MTKPISLCNRLQTAFAGRSRVPLPETNLEFNSRHWEAMVSHVVRIEAEALLYRHRIWMGHQIRMAVC